MKYEFLACKDIDLSRIGYQNASVQFDFRKDTSCLRVTLFDNDHYQDQVVIDLEYEFGNDSRGEVIE